MNMSKKKANQLVESDMVDVVVVGGRRRYRVNIARQYEKAKRYSDLSAEKKANPEEFNKDKAKKAELFDLYNDLLAIKVFAEKKQKGRDVARRTGRTNMTPSKKKRR